jgi:hypothetical protein
VWQAVASVADPAPVVPVAATERRWLPWAPAPFLDESLGSWLRRCAEGYVISEFAFASAVLALDQKPPPPGKCDWDTEPPPELLDSLARHTPYRLAELEDLVTPRRPSTLPPSMRDGYCPICFQEDQRRGSFYTRRAWLDAWTIWCPTHQCVFGQFQREEREKTPTVAVRNIDILFGRRYEGHEQTLRVNPSVSSATSRPCAFIPELRAWIDELPSGWFDPLMLQNIVGRDLVMWMGSAAADPLYYDLFGSARLWDQVWHDAQRRPLIWPHIDYPLGRIKIRVAAAFLASLVWQYMYESGGASLGAVATPLNALRRALASGMQSHHLCSMTHRWPRADREVWIRALGSN